MNVTVHVEEGRDVALLVLKLRELRGVAPLRPAILAHELLDVLRRSVARDVHEHGFVRGRRDARHRADLRVRDLALRERVRDLGQLLERARDAHFLARRDRADAALPVQPLRRVGEAVALVPFRAIELRDQREEARRRGVQISPELRDLRFELLERRALGGGLPRATKGRRRPWETSDSIAGWIYSIMRRNDIVESIGYGGRADPRWGIDNSRENTRTTVDALPDLGAASDRYQAVERISSNTVSTAWLADRACSSEEGRLHTAQPGHTARSRLCDAAVSREIPVGQACPRCRLSVPSRRQSSKPFGFSLLAESPGPGHIGLPGPLLSDVPVSVAGDLSRARRIDSQVARRVACRASATTKSCSGCCTIRTGQGACRTTFSATLPASMCSTKPRWCLPITMSSTLELARARDDRVCGACDAGSAQQVFGVRVLLVLLRQQAAQVVAGRVARNFERARLAARALGSVG